MLLIQVGSGHADNDMFCFAEYLYRRRPKDKHARTANRDTQQASTNGRYARGRGSEAGG